MKELGMISESEMRQAVSTDTLAKIKPLSQPMQFPHFVFYVLDQLEKKYGKEFVATGGLSIYTTLDYEMQKTAEDVVKRGAQRAASYGASNAALTAVDPKTGHILAMVGSKDFYDEKIDGQVNVTTRPRQPGSSFKPFVYAAAFIKGYQPETMVLDAPTDFGPGGANGRNYIPRNYDGKFHGLLPMRSTLAMSLNVPAVKVLYLTGIDAAIDLAHKMGITTLNDRDRYGLSLVLGGGEVKLLDMTSAFSVFATEGVRNPSTSVSKIIDSQGNTYEQFSSSPQRVMDVQIARKINSILSDNNARAPIFGSRSALFIEGRTVAAKTGTTSEFRDAWTVGYTPSISVGVWAGNNDNRPMRGGADGVFVAAPIWKDFMIRVLADKSDEKFTSYDTYKGKDEGNSTFKMKPKITYYNSKTGKRISEEKARKTDPEKVEKRIEYVPDYGSGSDSKNRNNIALPDPNDPAYKKWTDQLKKSEKSDKKNKKDDDD
jgi:membrane peptidoglycan carboxypeptidase